MASSLKVPTASPASPLIRRFAGISCGRYYTTLSTADETLSTAVVHTDRAGIRCFAGISPSAQLRRSMRSVFSRPLPMGS
jgi:hypothetical protein